MIQLIDQPQTATGRTSVGWRAALLCGVFALAAGMRLWDLSVAPLWVDEAESSINALTILEHGYPTSSYLGVPIYENTLIEPWPENPEFEFRDSSYSRKGIAVYHGWIPLYAIAASFAAFGVQPDLPASPPVPRYSREDRDRRTFAARFPSVVFGMAFLVTLYFGCSRLWGGDVGWAALLIGAFTPTSVDASRQARYYAAALLFALLCAMAVWMMAKRGRPRHFAAGGLLFVCLFHSHSILFAASVILFVLSLPVLFRTHLPWRGLALFGGIVVAGILPWAIAVGMLDTALAVPKAWPLLRPADLVTLPLRKWPYTLVVMGGLAGVLAGTAIPAARCSAFGRHAYAMRRPYLFVSAWLAVSYLAFFLLVPAASFFLSRMSTIIGAAIAVLMAMAFALAARMLAGRPHPVLASAFALAFLLLGSRFSWPRPVEERGLTAFLERVQTLRPAPATRFYGVPNSHLILTFYTGLPFASVAPVRKSFFDTYPGPILVAGPLFDELRPDDPASPPRLEAAAREAGVPLDPVRAGQFSMELATWDFRHSESKRVCRVTPPLPDSLPPFAAAVLDRQRELNGNRQRELVRFADATPITRGFAVHSMFDVWCVFFYRFVNPESRMGPNLNFAGRLREAEAQVIGDKWMLYSIPTSSEGCPGRAPYPSRASLAFAPAD